MIHVSPAPEPPEFDQEVRQPGLSSIAEMVGEPPLAKRPGPKRKKIAETRADIPPQSYPPFWTRALDAMMKAYDNICAYSCFRIHPVTGSQTVDHMAPKSRTWDQVYEWLNYRLACSKLNARKRDFTDILDPFEIPNGWFVLELVGFQVLPATDLEESIQTQVQNTIERLGLNDFCRSREQDAENYWAEHISFEILEQESPFVAKELKRQGQLLEKDIQNHNTPDMKKKKKR